MTDDDSLKSVFARRFSDAPQTLGALPQTLRTMAERGSCRSFRDQPVSMDLIEILCAAALSSPSKSDLQQRDIILLASPEKRRAVADLVADQHWVADAPMIAVFCGNNRRQRLLHDWHGIPFANDHLDAFFNAVGDAAIALGAFVTAAEASGLGCCPISAVRNKAAEISALLGLPDHVFPFAGLAIGYPAMSPTISKRLPLRATTHVDSYCEDTLRADVDTYDANRAASHPYRTQRLADTFGEVADYGWSLDKARQYSRPEREDFGNWVRSIGFRLE